MALVAVLAISATAMYGLWHRSADSATIVKLAKIVGPQRLTRARLSGGFAFAPCRTDTSTTKLVRDLACEVPPASEWPSASELGRFAKSMHEAKAGAPDAHAMGVWQLVMGHPDEAVTELKEAAHASPTNARVFNDLAVALTQSAQLNDDPSMLIDALVAADSALWLDRSYAEGQFTLAVLLEKLYLPTDAQAAWTRYLELDKRSPWAEEARARLGSLSTNGDRWDTSRERLLKAVEASDSTTINAVVAAYPPEIRDLIERQLATWSMALTAGDSAKGQRALNVARVLAASRQTATGDALPADAIAAIESAYANRDRDRLRALVDGHRALAAGTQLVNERKGPEATATLDTARKLFVRGKSPMSGWAVMFQARSRLYEFKRDEALHALDSIRRTTPTRYSVLRSLSAQYVGYIHDVRGDYVHSMAAYDTALAEIRTVGGDPQVTLRVGSWFADAARRVRGKQAGWRALYGALAATPRYSTSHRAVYSVMDNAAVATAVDAPGLSLRYVDELNRLARRMNDPWSMMASLRRRAYERALLRDTVGARADIEQAIAIAQGIKNDKLRDVAILDTRLADARIALIATPSQAEPGLQRVIDMYRATGQEAQLGVAYLYLAQARIASGGLDGARAAFDSATDFMERQRETVKTAAERTAFLDAARTTIDLIVAFHATRDSSAAFEYFEQTRSRVLLEQLAANRGAATPKTEVLKELQRRLAPAEVVLSYAVLPKETLVWAIGHDRFELHHVRIGAAEIEDLVNRLQQSLRDHSGNFDLAVAKRLHELLIAQAGPIAPETNLTIIPDRWLHYVPFAMLVDGKTGRFIVQDHAVSYASSATLLNASLSNTDRPFSRESKVLAVGDPAFDARVFELPDLPAAAKEAREVAEMYVHQKPLLGTSATGTALERRAPEVDILHFAGHAVVGRDAPQLSYLLLAPDGHSTGAVFASEIAQWHLPKMRLVVLSGCSTGDGKLSATEGASSLARAFFAAGAPAALSSLWPIDDEESAAFFVAFHQRLVGGKSPAVALRETQMQWLDSAGGRRHPVSSWAAFQLFGR